MLTIRVKDFYSIEYPAFILCDTCDEWECILCRIETCEGCLPNG